ncbi:ribosomal protein S12 methylthiotransferase [Clostridium tetanomorphum]|uniref:Ribosomal protein uS12 methylthiotransferase RimO n=1 Tax=Clostridium tetanomorphum TaxID=1553 RepID=A0A923J2R3_CLOTT|nr:30S ribosomal protein S12 methylthiotransferase RimO [Clostridium tetanomorphum]KAJ51579.1 Fe-S oxidoreductase [Clostridium tetanomorphum DSM 665]MBC2398933.1 30S ribosomal protein S12 methylthiotransferase RimO [Clostridium tetanomorphum]MBP1865228.1 ribosomal protein S12 methylthiotransferase [Clostridium tetanomorphum]NRS84633.1 ribosomal protein S12 methylthiotransferase [Clostridium tetanomorphum]NRZ97848.1 ribosomal protein S12 methylthiotransferase [Clostridium tetanomorphum]
MNKLKFGLVSLGCDKNRIDSEIMIGKISKNNTITSDPSEADVIIVNTCGFIEDAKQESIDTILEMTKYKQRNCKVLIVTGCLSQRYGKELQELLPEVDVMIGVNDYDKLEEAVKKVIEDKEKLFYCNYSDKGVNEGERVLTTLNHYAYLRIGEGCDNFCTYCVIPRIRGKYRSRKIENILNEAKTLAENGVKEIILVAQDTTRYGIDLYGKKMIHKLLADISKINGIEWIRVLYCYPEEMEDELIEEMACNSKVCKYLDMPIQHISNDVLKTMGRRGRKEQIIHTINKLRQRIPNIALRTSIIVGFPGESENNFNELKDFVKEINFEKLGVFKYSQEENTPAAIMENQIEDKIKEIRQKELMELQQRISKKINNLKVGKIYEVIVDSFDGEYYIGRNYEMAPEIDGAIYFKCDKILNIGEIVSVKIESCSEYDLIGVVYYESCK